MRGKRVVARPYMAWWALSCCSMVYVGMFKRASW